jgi:hypothetical protein
MTFSSWTGSNWGVGEAPSWGFESQTRVDDNKWHHIALVYDHDYTISFYQLVYGAWKLYVDGVLEADPGTMGDRMSSNHLWIGAGGDYYTGFPNYFYEGQLDQLRITKSKRYTSNFTPPTKPFAGNIDASILTVADPYWDNVFFQHNFNTPQIWDDDKSNSNHTVTVHGSPQFSTTVKKFGNASAQFNGSGQHLKIATGGSFFGGSAAHTFECWFRTTSLSYQYLVSRNAAQHYGGLSFHPSGGTITWGGNATGTDLQATNVTIDLDTWHHVAALVDGNGNADIIFNGTQVATTSAWAAWGMLGNDLTFGAQTYNGQSPRMTIDGYIDNIRITNGVARDINDTNYGTDFDSEVDAVWFPLSGTDDKSTHGNITIQTPYGATFGTNDTP